MEQPVHAVEPRPQQRVQLHGVLHAFAEAVRVGVSVALEHRDLLETGRAARARARLRLPAIPAPRTIARSPRLLLLGDIALLRDLSFPFEWEQIWHRSMVIFFRAGANSPRAPRFPRDRALG